MQSKVAQLVDLFLTNDHYDDPPPESQSTEGSTTTTATTVTLSSARNTHSPSSSEPINRTDDDPSDGSTEDHEVHLRIYPFLDPTDWILRIDENTPCLSYVVSKLWSWEQIKHCICYELRLHASCTPRQIGEVTDYYYQPYNKCNNEDVIHQPRPICNRADFLNAIQRPPESSLHSNTTTTSSQSYHVLDILATCKPLNDTPHPTSKSRDMTESHPSSNTTGLAAVVANPTLTDIGMAEALMGLRQASAATPVGESDSIDPQETHQPWHDDGVHVGRIDVPANYVPHEQCTSSSQHGIDIWNSGPQDDQEAHTHDSNDNGNDSEYRAQGEETTAMPPPAFPTPVHSCNAIYDEQSHRVERSEAHDNDQGHEDYGEYDDGVSYPYSDTSDDDSQLEPPTVNTNSKKRPRTQTLADSKTLSGTSSLPCEKKPPGQPKGPSRNHRRQDGVCIETTTMTTTSGIILPVLNPYDVMCSRSKVAFKAIGNRRLRIIMELHAARYATTFRKVDKTAIVSSIVEIVNGAGGNFIRRNRTTGIWEIAPHEIAKEKVGHGLRDAVGNIGRSIYDVLGHDYYSKIHRKKDIGQIMLQQIAQKAPVACKPPPEPPVPVPNETSTCSAAVSKPSYVSRTIPVRFGSPCKKSHGYPRTSYGPFKKRLLSNSSPISGGKASAKKAVANKKPGLGSPPTHNTKSSPPSGGVDASAGKPVANNAAGIGSTAAPNNKSSPPSGGVNASTDKPVATNTAGVGIPPTPNNKSPQFVGVNAPPGKPVANNKAGIGTMPPPRNKSPSFSGVSASTDKPVVNNEGDIGSKAEPNTKSPSFIGTNAPADKTVAKKIPAIATLTNPINKSPSFFVFKASTGKAVAKHIPGMGTPGPPIIKKPRFVTLKAPAGKIVGTPMGISPPLVRLKAPVGKAVTIDLTGVSPLRIPNNKGCPRSKCGDAEAVSLPRAKRQRQMVITTPKTRSTRACSRASVANASSSTAATTTTGTSDSGYVPSPAV